MTLATATAGLLLAWAAPPQAQTYRGSSGLAGPVAIWTATARDRSAIVGTVSLDSMPGDAATARALGPFSSPTGAGGQLAGVSSLVGVSFASDGQ